MDTEKSKIAFLTALNKVQGTLGSAKKDSSNPHFKSRYASLEAVNEAVMGPLTEAGFVLMSGGVDITSKPYLRTTLHHIGGHSESFDYPLVNDGNPQHIASSVTYARRYAICALLNLSIEDDDGNAAAKVARTEPAKESTARTYEPVAESGGVRRVSEAQGKRFYAIAMSNGKSPEAIRAYQEQVLKIAKGQQMAASQYEAAIKWAESKEAEVADVPF